MLQKKEQNLKARPSHFITLAQKEKAIKHLEKLIKDCKEKKINAHLHIET